MPDAVADVQRLARRHADAAEHDAFFVCDLRHVRQRLVTFRRLLPRVAPCYAVKCNPDARLLGAVAAAGGGFDVASVDELRAVQRVLPAEALAERLVYANPVKCARQLAAVAAAGVRRMTFDSAPELRKIAATHGAARLQLLLRIAVDDLRARIPLASKYGAHPAQVRALLECAAEHNLSVVGVAFHVGSGALSHEPYIAALHQVRQIFDVAQAMQLSPMRVVDIGGGFAGYDGELPVTFAHIAAAIAPVLDELFAPNVHIIAEPGRFIASSAFSLVSRVVAVRRRRAMCDYYIGDGVYGAFKDAVLLNVQFKCRLLRADQADEAVDSAAVKRCTMRGPTNDPYDVVLRDVALPPMEVGDWVLFANMGAYTLALSSDFGGIRRPPIYYID